MSFSLTALKQAVLYPFENNEEHDNLAYQFNVLRQIGMANNGSVITKDDEGYVVIKPLADRYNNQLKYAKAKKMVQDNKLNKNNTFITNKTN